MYRSAPDTMQGLPIATIILGFSTFAQVQVRVESKHLLVETRDDDGGDLVEEDDNDYADSSSDEYPWYGQTHEIILEKEANEHFEN